MQSGPSRKRREVIVDGNSGVIIVAEAGKVIIVLAKGGFHLFIGEETRRISCTTQTNNVDILIVGMRKQK